MPTTAPGSRRSLFGAEALTERCIRLVPASVRQTPYMASQVPSGLGQRDPELDLLLGDDLPLTLVPHRRRRAFAADLWPAAQAALGAFPEHVNADGAAGYRRLEPARLGPDRPAELGHRGPPELPDGDRPRCSRRPRRRQWRRRRRGRRCATEADRMRAAINAAPLVGRAQRLHRLHPRRWPPVRQSAACRRTCSRCWRASRKETARHRAQAVLHDPTGRLGRDRQPVDVGLPLRRAGEPGPNRRCPRRYPRRTTG